MKRFQSAVQRMRAQASDDAGISIVEVVAAIMIFALLSIGLAQGLVTSVRLAGDQKHRITALSLAASDIDLVRGKTAFAIDSDDYDTEIDGTVYTITRSVEWVDANGNDVSCGTGSGTKLRVLRVNVDVTWAGQVRPISPVNFDTVVAPDGSLHDEDLAVLLISVNGADGTGVAGLDVALTATTSLPTGTIVPTPTKTNSHGCSYAIGVPPASYNVSVSKANYISSDQVATTVVKSITLAAGATASTNFVFDRAGSFPVTLVAPNGANPSPVKFATTAPITVSGGRGQQTVSRASVLALFPWLDGYSLIYGAYTPQSIDGAADPALNALDGCQSPNPSTWGAVVIDGTALNAGVTPSAVALPAQTAAMTALGVGYTQVKFANGYQTNRTVTAVTTAAPNSDVGDPGCGATLTYTFTGINEGDVLALPFGTWKLSSVTSSVDRLNEAKPLSNAAGYPMPGAKIVTLDPRLKS